MTKLTQYFVFTSLLFLTVCFSSQGYAVLGTVTTNKNESSMADSVVLSDTWARATFALAKTGAAYMKVQNTSNTDVHLVSASVGEDVASAAELHETQMNDGMMKMQELADGVLISQGESISFVPGGKHIMLMGLTGPLEAEKQVAITLVFSDDSTLTHTFPIKDARKVKM
jgi:copper(I)-binding protein